ncbi:hypothetical protein [Thioalkalivibrio sp. XN8]|uniref:hypothetical protein n=1 Tax=Thioalkalivibrio sp. XN8 TaxID=2712863 RepID=UPI0013EBBA21|nr:hypothetical protein [Thioalkalivibrio sp. XN8]NGP54453.1 hypothetical protein [Thioalkalivibrio sp. XN8]
MPTFPRAASCCAPFSVCLLAGISLTSLVGCGGSSSSPAPPQADNVDDLVLETSQFWDSAARGVGIAVVYETAAGTVLSATEAVVRSAGFGELRASRIALDQGERRLLADDFGAQFLVIELGQGVQVLPIGQATRAISPGCDLGLAQQLRIDDEIGQGRLEWRFEETVTLDDNGGQPRCADVLDAFAASLDSSTEVEFPYDLVSLVGLRAVDVLYLDQLRSWTVTHSQVVAKYFRAIGDERYELAGPAQRVRLDVFEPADVRAEQLLSQLTP